jgi:hypothetical protein
MPKSKSEVETPQKTASAAAVDMPAKMPQKSGSPGASGQIQREKTIPAPPEAADLGAGAAERGRATRALQRQIGNDRLGRMLDAPVQRAVSVSSPDDRFEREAKSVADHVTGDSQSGPPKISRMTTNDFQRMAVQRETSDGYGGQARLEEAAGRALDQKDPGRPMDQDTRRTLESRMGADLSKTRVHDNAQSQHSAQDLNARAFTHGNDIWLGQGESDKDTRLMAHELTHTIQQIGGTEAHSKAAGKLTISEPAHSQEGEADLVARDITGDETASTPRQRDAFKGKSYDTNTKEGASKFIDDWHTQLLWDYLDLMDRKAKYPEEIVAGRAFFIYTENYQPKLRQMVEITPPMEVMKATMQLVQQATTDAKTEADSAKLLDASNYRTIFPEMHAREYEIEAKKLRDEAAAEGAVLERYKVESVSEKEDFLNWGEWMYYPVLTADKLEAEAARIRKGEWTVFNLEDHLLFFKTNARVEARALAEKEYPVYQRRVSDEHNTWALASGVSQKADLAKQSREAAQDLISIEVIASQMRIQAGKEVLPVGLIDAWVAADLAMMAIVPSAAKGETYASGQAIPMRLGKDQPGFLIIGRDTAVAAVLKFLSAFRSVVAHMDQTKRVTGKALIESGIDEYTINPYYSEDSLGNAVWSIKNARTAQDWMIAFRQYNRAVTGLDTYIADLLAKKGRKEEGEQLKAAGTMERELTNLLTEHPTTQKVRAVFYPIDQIENLGKPGAPEFRAKAIHLYFYTYRKEDTWYLVDVTTPHQVKINKEAGNQSRPPAELFNELNTKLRFPKGRLYYTLADGTGGMVETTAEMRLSEWLTWIGVGVAVIALTVATLGASIPATVLFIAGGVVGATAAAADIYEKHEAGVLTARDIVVDTLAIVANLATAGSAGLGKIVASGALKTGQMARIAALADQVYAPITLTAMGADVASLAVFAEGVWENLQAIDKMPGSDSDRKLAKARLFAQFLLMGGITLLSIKGNLPGVLKGKSLFLDLEPNGTIIARPYLSNAELLENAARLQKPQEIVELLSRTDLPPDLMERIRAGVSQALTVGPVGSAKLGELIASLRRAATPTEVNSILLEITTRSRIGSQLGMAAAGNLTTQQVNNLALLQDEVLASLKDASPSSLRYIAGIVGSDQPRAIALMKEYGSEFSNYIRFNPVSSLDELENALRKARDEVKQQVSGLVESITVTEPPMGWKFRTPAGVETGPDGTRVVRTVIEGPNGASGYFERAYNPNTGTLEMRNAFLVMAGAKKGLPSMITEVKVPMVPAKGGTPTIHYLNLYQMKMLGVPLAGQGGLLKVKMSTIQNVETIVHLHWLRQRWPNLTMDELISQTASVKYAENSLIQSGYQRTGNARFIPGDEAEAPIRKLLAHMAGGKPTRIAEHTALLQKYGFERDTVMKWNFDIEFDVAPIPRSQP